MLQSMADKATLGIYDGVNSRYARKLQRELHGKARRLLVQINAASSLEALQGDLAGFWSLRIKDQWRIIFRWEGNDAQDVKITDYHR